MMRRGTTKKNGENGMFDIVGDAPSCVNTDGLPWRCAVCNTGRSHITKQHLFRDKWHQHAMKKRNHQHATPHPYDLTMQQHQQASSSTRRGPSNWASHAMRHAAPEQFYQQPSPLSNFAPHVRTYAAPPGLPLPLAQAPWPIATTHCPG